MNHLKYTNNNNNSLALYKNNQIDVAEVLHDISKKLRNKGIEITMETESILEFDFCGKIDIKPFISNYFKNSKEIEMVGIEIDTNQRSITITSNDIKNIYNERNKNLIKNNNNNNRKRNKFDPIKRSIEDKNRNRNRSPNRNRNKNSNKNKNKLQTNEIIIVDKSSNDNGVKIPLFNFILNIQ